MEEYYLTKKDCMPGASERVRISGVIKPGSRVHVSAVCGKVMASIACMLKEFGCEVSGSDTAFNPPMSTILEEHEIACLEPSVENIKDIDLLVVGNALSYSSLEPKAAREENTPMISGAEAAAQIFAGKRSLVVAGTHGKTTTSGLLTHVYDESGQTPAYLLGGVFQGKAMSYSLGGKGGVVIYEGDEYNCAFFDQAPKFLRYNASSAIITSLEYDHVDLYADFEDYKQAFQFLVDSIPPDGFLVVHESVGAGLNLAKCAGRVVTYGSGAEADVRYRSTAVSADGTIFSIESGRVEPCEEVFIPMFGSYNIENAVSVYALSLLEGLPQDTILQGLASFPGTKERQEWLGDTKDKISVIRDYAHHPTAVQLTLSGLKERYPNRRILAVLELNSNSSRQKIFEERYGQAFLDAGSAIVIAPQRKEGSKPADEIDVVNVVNAISKSGAPAFMASNPPEALRIAQKEARPGDVIVFMSSGSMEGIAQKFLSP